MVTRAWGKGDDGPAPLTPKPEYLRIRDALHNKTRAQADLARATERARKLQEQLTKEQSTTDDAALDVARAEAEECRVLQEAAANRKGPSDEPDHCPLVSAVDLVEGRIELDFGAFFQGQVEDLDEGDKKALNQEMDNFTSQLAAASKVHLENIRTVVTDLSEKAKSARERFSKKRKGTTESSTASSASSEAAPVPPEGGAPVAEDHQTIKDQAARLIAQALKTAGISPETAAQQQ